MPAALTVGFAAVFTRVFPTAEFGRYSLVMSLVALLSGLSTPWLEQAVLRYVPGTKNAAELGPLLGAAAVAMVAVAGVTLGLGTAASLVLRPALPPDWASLVVPALVALVVLGLFTPLGVVQQARMRAGRYSRYKVLESVVRFALALLLVFGMARRADSLVWAHVVSAALVVPFLWREGGLPAWSALRRSWRAYAPTVAQFARYGFPLIGYSMAATLLDSGDRYVIQFTRGTGEVGIYSANYGLAHGGAVLATAPILMAAHPLLMRAWGEGDQTKAAEWLARMTVSLGVLGVGVTAAVWLLAPSVAAVLLGAQFREGYVVMAPVVAGVLAWQLGMYAHKPLEFAGRTGVMFSAGLAMAVINLVLNLVFVPRYGYVAAAYTTLACYAGYAALTFRLGQRYVTWRLDLRPIVMTLLAVAPVATSAAWLTRGAPPLGGAAILNGLAAVLVGLGVPLLILRRYDPATLGRPLHV